MNEDDICNVKWDFKDVTKNCKNPLITSPCPNEIKSLFFNQPERSKREDAFNIYRPDNYPGPIAINATPSKECKEYHENSCIQINIDGKNIIKRCGALNTMET